MANIQVNQFPEKLSPADADVVHLKGDSDNGDYKTPISGLKQVIVTDQIATTGEAQTGTSNVKLMTPVKTAAYVTNQLASQAEAEAAVSTSKLVTPKGLDDYGKVNAPYLSVATNILTGGGTLVAGKEYLITDALLYTLPIVTSFTGGEKVTLNRLAAVEPVIQREGTESEQLRINGVTLDTAITYDINSQIIFIYNNSTNEWEV